MTTMTQTTNTAVTLAEATALIWLEADLLDTRDYAAWLDLWTEGGIYAIPTDPTAVDLAASLNYAYDDAAMRRMRVERLTAGHAISSSPAAATVRTVSRFRLLSADAAGCEVRCALHLVDYKFERQRVWAADLTYRLVREPSGLAIDQKVVRLINAGDALAGLSYLL
jgi:3-phenylpropionate/cinnamic acid dioxygenase small subunit